jgi:CBS domain-containing protein
MARTPLAEATDLTVGEVVHTRFSALPADITVAQVRDWFGESSHRRIAVLADEGRYAGTLGLDDLAGDLDPRRPAAELASDGPTVDPRAPAQTAFDLATASPARRVAVVDGDGQLVGVVGVTEDLAAFCGTS